MGAAGGGGLASRCLLEPLALAIATQQELALSTLRGVVFESGLPALITLGMCRGGHYRPNVP